MMVLASVYISVSSSLPVTAGIKYVEVWLLFNLAYPVLVILANIVLKVTFTKFCIANNLIIQNVTKKIHVDDGKANKTLKSAITVVNIVKATFTYRMPTNLSSPRGARAFHELRRYHTRPLRLNWGPENVHF